MCCGRKLVHHWARHRDDQVSLDVFFLISEFYSCNQLICNFHLNQLFKYQEVTNHFGGSLG